MLCERERERGASGSRVCVVRGIEFRLAGLAGTQRDPVNIPGVSVCVCVSLPPFSPTSRTFIVLPPHWLQHYDVTSRLIGCEAAEGRRRDAGREREREGENRGRE